MTPEPFVVDFEHRGQRFCPRPKTCSYAYQRGETLGKNPKQHHGVRGSYRMSEETRAKVSESLVRGYRQGREFSRFEHQHHLYRSADREVLMRSLSEVLFAEQLDQFGVEWQYEPQRFFLGWTTYTPDFYLPAFNRWIEIKGFWEEGSKSQRKFIEFCQTHNACVVWAKDVQHFTAWRKQALSGP